MRNIWQSNHSKHSELIIWKSQTELHFIFLSSIVGNSFKMPYTLPNKYILTELLVLFLLFLFSLFLSLHPIWYKSLLDVILCNTWTSNKYSVLKWPQNPLLFWYKGEFLLRIFSFISHNVILLAQPQQVSSLQ